MSTIIVMPQLGESVAEGVIGKWLKNEGDQIARDEPIVEVITDKVNAEIPSPVAGVLEKITQPEGATVAVGQEIAVIGDGTGASQSTQLKSQADEASVPAMAPVDSAPVGDRFGGGNGQGPGGSVATLIRPVVSGERSERVRSSPLVRRLAEQHGIDLTAVPGTGIGGRVSKHDILAFVEQQAQAPAPTVSPPPMAVTATAPSVSPPSAPQPTRMPGQYEELVPVSPLRRMIAERMVQSVYSIPHATTMAEVDMTPVVRYREGRKDEFRQREGVALSYVAFVIKAVVEALKQYPLVNAEWAGEHIILKHAINLNLAVDAPEGLTTPVIHRADERSLAGLSKAIGDLAVRARQRKLRVEDMQGGTFTVNNTGAIGSTAGVSIINYPQAGILSAAAIVKRPVVLEQDGQDLIAVRSMMNLSFTFDHRVLDGGYAAGFVQSVKRALEGWPIDYPLY